MCRRGVLATKLQQAVSGSRLWIPHPAGHTTGEQWHMQIQH